MNGKAFFDAVAAMREQQQLYFRTKDTRALQRAKALEHDIDAEIARVRVILRSRSEGTAAPTYNQPQRGEHPPARRYVVQSYNTGKWAPPRHQIWPAHHL